MARFTIRPYRPADEAPVLAAWLAAWQRTLPEVDFAARLPGFRQHWAGLVARAAVRVAEVEGDAVGAVTVEPDGLLDQLLVDPAHWGNGIAEALIAEAKALSPAGLRLDVNLENPRAVRFYARMGFETRGEGTSPTGRPVAHLAWPGAG